MRLSDFIRSTYEREELTDYLIRKQVFRSTARCVNCNRTVALNRRSLSYSCRKRHTDRPRCNFWRSAKTATWFARCHVSYGALSRLVAYFAVLPPPRQRLLEFDIGVTSKTIIEWIKLCREVCLYWARTNSQRLGGAGCTVEIDEARIGRRKYNRGRRIEGNWIFGGYERDTKRVFLVSIPNRTRETLFACIERWILPGTTVISDCWRSYNCLTDAGFHHLRVNHSYNFIDPDTGAHTQSIERVWREVRANIPRFGTRATYFAGYLAEYLFKRVHPLERRIDAFFSTIGEMYSAMKETPGTRRQGTRRYTESALVHTESALVHTCSA